LLHVIKGFESEEIAQYQEIFHPLQQLQMLEQELIQMVRSLLLTDDRFTYTFAMNTVVVHHRI